MEVGWPTRLEIRVPALAERGDGWSPRRAAWPPPARGIRDYSEEDYPSPNWPPACAGDSAGDSCVYSRGSRVYSGGFGGVWPGIRG